MKTDTGAIGVLGGVGPYAGLDLMRKIFDQTEANCDQEHLSVIQYSLSEHIIDRTRFLLGETDENPGEAIGEIMVRMAKAGATVIGVPCNTAHSPRIMDVAVAMLHEASPKTRFVNMIDSVVAFIRESLPCPEDRRSEHQGDLRDRALSGCPFRRGIRSFVPG